MKNMDLFYMQKAVDLAKTAKKRGDFPFGAVITKNREIISIGTCEEVTRHDVTLHAELQAVSRACKKLGTDLSDCTLYATAEPCNMCASAIFQAKIKYIFIAASREDLCHFLRKRKIKILDLAKDLNFSPKFNFGIMRKEVIDLFSDVKKDLLR